MQEKAIVPAIRFAGFTDAWEQRKLGEMSYSFEYGLNAASTTFDGKNRYIRITDIDDDTRLFLVSDLTSPDFDLRTAKNYRLQKGDIVFARTGASVGKTYIYKPFDGIMYYAGFLIRARIRPEYSAEFVFQNTLTERYKKFVNITSQRSGQPGINAQEYSTFEFLVPEYKEQQKIGTFFRHLDHLITLHQRKYSRLCNIKKSMLERMFPKEGASVPEIRFAGFTDAWEQRKLGECFSERIESMPGGELLSVTISEGIKRFSDLGRHNNSNEDKSKYKKVCIGDIAYNSMRMWQGASGYSPYEGIVSPAYTVLAPNPGINSQCLAYHFKLPEMIHTFQINSQGITSDTWNLKFPALSEIEIFVSADEREQEKIAGFFRHLDHLITLHQRELERLQNIKKSCLEKMFV